MTPTIPNPHALSSDDVSRRLDVDASVGLGREHAAARRAQHGANVIPRQRQRGAARILVDQFVNIIVLLLAVAAAISWATGDRLQAAAIAVVLLLNAGVGFFTEWQAGRALDALRKQTRITARVRRGGDIETIPAEELTVGDVVLLAAGDRVPADLRVIEAASLRTEEAPLTGESRSVSKTAEAVPPDAPLADRTSMLYLGTIVTAGRAVAVVVATGGETELGRIGRLVMEVEAEPTPLQKRLAHLGRRLVYIVIVIGAVVMVTGWLRGDPLWEMAEVGISLAVAAVPEGLPAVTTFILAFGVLRMARRNAIVRRLAAVEALGSTTVICSDKTGTLTLNHMTVMEFRLAGGARVVMSEMRETPPLLGEAAIVGALCNEATHDGGDPTEVALVDAALAIGIDVDALRRQYPRLSEEPFDSKTKRMVTVHRVLPSREDGEESPADSGGATFAAVKGAPGVILDMCDLSAEERAQWIAANEEMAGAGLRVLALAKDRQLLALVGMTDPPRPGVVEAIATAHRAGIRVVMLTGDQAATAAAIARELGIDEVHARVSPEEKFRIVEALQKRGEIVAVTGDGVNDAPALKRADVGVAMGQRGTEVAKEAAAIVLADDNFATIVAAIDGGRTIYANIVKFVHMMFSHNINEVVSIFVAIAVGWPLPLAPLQILWMNLVTDVLPAFALALEPGSPEAMLRPPRPPSQPLFSGVLMATIAWQALLLAVVTLATYRWALDVYGGGAHARTVALLALIGVQIGQTLNCRSRIRSAFSGITRNPYLALAAAAMLVLQMMAFSLAPLRRVLGVVTPSPADLVAFALAIVVPVVVVEIQKLCVRRRLRWSDAS
jgi:Ca2+-transporting ATPase